MQIVNLIVAGLMVMAAAVGSAGAGRTGSGQRWAPRLLLGTFGLGMVAAGIFPTDPMAGFPMGTPDGPPVAPTLSGLLHLVCAGVGFLALIVAALVVARRFRSQGRTGRAAGPSSPGSRSCSPSSGSRPVGRRRPSSCPLWRRSCSVGLRWRSSFDVYTELCLIDLIRLRPNHYTLKGRNVMRYLVLLEAVTTPDTPPPADLMAAIMALGGEARPPVSSSTPKACNPAPPAPGSA